MFGFGVFILPLLYIILKIKLILPKIFTKKGFFIKVVIVLSVINFS